jgi:hypothetical protein
MADKLQKYKHHMHVICRSPVNTRKAILSECPAEFVQCIGECALNVLQGNVQTDGASRKKLRQYKAHLRELADKRVSIDKKRKRLVQSGGGILLALLPAIISAIAGLASG